jgi:hypothetical protein
MPALLIRGGTVVNHDDSRPADVPVDGGTIAAIGSRLGAPTGAEVTPPLPTRPTGTADNQTPVRSKQLTSFLNWSQLTYVHGTFSSCQAFAPCSISL